MNPSMHSETGHSETGHSEGGPGRASEARTGTGAGLRAGSAALWASAVVLCGLILTQASNVGTGSAQAGLVSQVSEMTAMTVRSGPEEVLLVLDNRNEELFVYQVQNQKSVELVQKYSVSQMFTNARTSARGG